MLPSVRLIVILLFVLMVVAVGFTSPPDEEWLLDRYEVGDLDTLLQLLPSIPETSAVGQFIRGLFEPNGEEARFYYDRIVVFHPGSIVEPYALERLWQYHYAKGDMVSAQRYYDFLRERHRDYSGLTIQPDFSGGGRLEELRSFNPPTVRGRTAEIRIDPIVTDTDEQWAVQAGAFSQEDGAQRRADEIRRFGTVQIKTKRIAGGRQLIVVLVGRFHQRADAQRLARQIQQETGLQTRTVSIGQ